MQPYHMLFKKAEEGGFTGKCLELPGAISEGETMEELRETDRSTLVSKSYTRSSRTKVMR